MEEKLPRPQDFYLQQKSPILQNNLTGAKEKLGAFKWNNNFQPSIYKPKPYFRGVVYVVGGVKKADL